MTERNRNAVARKTSGFLSGKALVFLMVQACQQKLFRLPIVGKFAAEQAGIRL